MTAIETKEIKGWNLRNLLALVVATVSMCTTVLVSYSNLTAQIVKTQTGMDKVQLKVDSDLRYTDLRMTVLEKTVTLLQMQIDNLKK